MGPTFRSPTSLRRGLQPGMENSSQVTVLSPCLPNTPPLSLSHLPSGRLRFHCNNDDDIVWELSMGRPVGITCITFAVGHFYSLNSYNNPLGRSYYHRPFTGEETEAQWDRVPCRGSPPSSRWDSYTGTASLQRLWLSVDKAFFSCRQY